MVIKFVNVTSNEGVGRGAISLQENQIVLDDVVKMYCINVVGDILPMKYIWNLLHPECISK